MLLVVVRWFAWLVFAFLFFELILSICLCLNCSHAVFLMARILSIMKRERKS